MTRYLLDTNIVSDLQTDTTAGSKILKKLQNLNAEDEVSVSIIVLYELVYGMSNLSDPQQKKSVLQGIEFIKEYLSVIPLDMKEVDIFARLKTQFKQATGITKNAIRRHNLALLIASTALAVDAVIVSDDAIFEKLTDIEPSLRCENWLRD